MTEQQESLTKVKTARPSGWRRALVYLPVIIGIPSIILMKVFEGSIENYIVPDLEWLNKIQGTEPSISNMMNATKSAFSSVIIAFWSLLIGILQLFIWNKNHTVEDLSNIYNKQSAESGKKIHSYSTGIDEKIKSIQANIWEIRDRIDRPGRLQKVRIAIFDKLLIYSPLFVAKEMKYFEEEGLDVEFVTIGSDKEIEDKVSSNVFQFGACDPYFCIENFGKLERTRTQILIPLAKRLGLYILAAANCEEAIKKTKSVVIGSFSEGSTTYLAACAFKSWLEAALSERGASVRVSIDALPPSDPCFSSPSQLKQKMRNWTFAALWEPNVSWLLGGRTPEYGVVSIKVDPDKSQPTAFKVLAGSRPIGASGFLGEALDWKAWIPSGLESAGSHKCLVSALITNRSVIEREPELARRVFRAVSRANIHLHALDEVEDSSSGVPLWKKIQGVLNHGKEVDASVLTTLVGETPAGMSAEERGGVIPFVPGISHYSEDHYLTHLKACHMLWKENNGTTTTSIHGADKDYTPYFVKTDEFALSAR